MALFVPLSPELSMSSTTARYLEGALHHHRAFSPRGISERLFTFWFNSFVYNQIWEDPRVDLKALALQPDSRMLTISSGGCNVLNYLIHKPEHIQAVDLNRSHLCLLKLKLAAIEHLPSYDDFFLFFGCADDELNRYNYFTYLAQHLDENSREFWEKGHWLRRVLFGPRIKYFTKNFYDYAKMGYFIRFLHTIARACNWDPARLLSASSRVEQEQIFEQDIAPFFDNWLVRAGGRLPVALYSLGIPPQQFSAMETETGGGLVAMYRERVKRLACDFPISENYFGWQAFGRGYDRAARLAMPEYLKEEHFETLRENLHRVSVKNVTLLEHMRSQPAGSLDRFVFLDSQDWMKPEQIAEMWTEIARVGKPGSRIVFRTAATDSPVETALPPTLRKRFDYKETLSRALLQEDRSAIYGGFHLYVME
jgi:S-adenosylmethionine-diacylglycerol 3-amino-3-carboxypropyl transferase